MAKLYIEAGRVVDEVLSGKCGLKDALYAKPLAADPRAVCKLASSALARRQVLRKALDAAGLITLEEGGKQGISEDSLAQRPGVAMVMAYDLLLGRGLRGGGKLSRELKSRKAELEASMKASGGDQVSKQEPDAGGAFADLPRYIRINRLLSPSQDSVDAARQRLSAKLVESLNKELADGRSAAPQLAEVHEDQLVPELLVLDPGAKSWIQGLPDVRDGTFVLQDRSSCLSALAAGLTPGTFVADTCAAPGSKTAHAIELLKGRGRMLAFERDPRRAGSLVERLKLLVGLKTATGGGATGVEDKSAGNKKKKAAPREVEELQFGSTVRGQARSLSGSQGVGVEVRVADFLDTKPGRKPCKDVEVLIVDPSCSGSGLPEHHLLGGRGASGSTNISTDRLHRLAAFQRKILAHALRFPKARTVVYSTCSTHREENEDVVEAVLNASPKPPFAVVQALSWWRNGPHPDASNTDRPLPSWAEHCIRCDPATHRCRGFFLCRLDRIAGSEDNSSGQQAEMKRKKKRRKPTCAEQRAAKAVAPKKSSDKAPPAVSKKRKGQKLSGVRIFSAGAAATPQPVAENPKKRARK